MNEDDVANMLERNGSYGRLKEFKRCRDPFVCEICEKTIQEKSPGYDQSDYTQTTLYPTKRRMCFDCGQELIKQGVEVKEKKK